ncbi:MAG: LPS export ABC transporter periplasmic protein LptC [bacterium]|nr:LPS export ABC transporter periplasmic protein LptC [bacterium]
MRKLTVYGLFILILTGIVILLLVKKGDKTGQEDKDSSSQSAGAELGLSGFHLIETIGGKPQWELWAKKAEVTKTQTNLEEIKCVFFSLKQDNEPILNVAAKKGILDTQTRDIELKNDVKAVTKDGAEFITNTLRWRAKQGILITPDKVSVIYGKAHLSGYGLEIDSGKDRIEIKEKVRIVIK